MADRKIPEINAGSMADIAFLLLIFFLVTTTIEKDSGIPRQLPPLDQDQPIDVVIKEKNVFQVNLNKNNQIFVKTAGEEKIIELKDIREMAIAFIDNGGGIGNPAEGETEGKRCDYCRGERKQSSSDHPNKAIISLQADGETEYGSYVEVQNELMAAYNFLRDREATRLYNRTYQDMAKEYSENPFAENREEMKEQVDRIKKLYPLLLSEAEKKK